MTKIRRAEAYKRQRFAEISARELDQLFDQENGQLLVKLLGEDDVEQIEEIGRNFNIVLKALHESYGWEARQPRRKTLQSVRKIHEALSRQRIAPTSANPA